MNILVTGGAGFIGSNLVDLLRSEGHQVLVLDDLSSGRRENLSPDVPFYEMPAGDPRVLEVLERHAVEVVCHHAAQIDVRKSVTDPVHDASINIIQGLGLLENCRRAGVRKIVYASTGGAIYGEPGPERLPATEEAPIKPISAYGVSKHTFEHYLELYRFLHGLDFTALRYANVYGPRQDPLGEAGVVAIFLSRLLAGQAPTIFGDGRQTRDYVFVEDVCRANLLALETGGGEILNIGTGLETSVLDLLSVLTEVLGVTCEPELTVARPGEVFRIALDASRAHRVLGWQPRTSLHEGLARTAAFFRESVAAS